MKSVSNMKLCIVFFVCIALAYGRNIYDSLPQCTRNDPNIEKCILDRVEAIKPTLREPFEIARLNVSSSNGVASGMKGTLQNIEARRWSDFRIEHLKVNLNNIYKYTSELVVTLPHLALSADYAIQGKMFGLNFRSYGKFKGSFNNIQVVAEAVASTVTKHGVEYLRVDDITMRISFGDGRLKLKPADHSYIGRHIASFASSDPSNALQMMTPAIEENAARIAKQYMNNFLAKVPLEGVLVD